MKRHAVCFLNPLARNAGAVEVIEMHREQSWVSTYCCVAVLALFGSARADSVARDPAASLAEQPAETASDAQAEPAPAPLSRVLEEVEPPPAALKTEADTAAPAQRSASVRGPQVFVRGQSFDRDGRVTLDLEVISPSGEDVEIVPRIDGKPPPGYLLTAKRNVAKAQQFALALPLPARDFELTLVAKGRTIAGQPLTLRMRRERRGATVDRRPKLYIVSIGVGNYQSPDIAKLTYAAKDARDLAQTLQSQLPHLYRAIESRILTDEKATREQVLQSLGWLQENVQREDMAAIFLAGHGTNDTEGSYYFLPVDAQANKLTMVAGTELQQGLQRIQGKVVLMLDTCHSGNVLGRSSLTRLINDLANENRVIVLAASTGDQTSRESPAWRNGAFTKALLEGLRGVADYTEDGAIAISELETWVSDRVKSLTASAQTPTLAKPNAAPDYLLSALPARGVLPNPKQALRRKVLYAAGGVAVGLGLAIGVLFAVRPWTQDGRIIDVAF